MCCDTFFVFLTLPSINLRCEPGRVVGLSLIIAATQGTTATPGGQLAKNPAVGKSNFFAAYVPPLSPRL